MPKFDADPKLIRALGEAMRETGLTEIEISDGGKTVRLSSQQPPAPVVAPPPPALPAPASAATPPAMAAPQSAPEPEIEGDAVTSPMVGTVYLSPSPEEGPFVQVGERVTAGQTLMIIEAMKVMNPIAAPRAGVIAAVLVSDKQPVEFGEPLLIIG